jgi:hypothetical protein
MIIICRSGWWKNREENDKRKNGKRNKESGNIWDMMRTFVLSEGTSSIYCKKLTHKYKYDGNNPTYFILFMVIVKTTILW